MCFSFLSTRIAERCTVDRQTCHAWRRPSVRTHEHLFNVSLVKKKKTGSVPSVMASCRLLPVLGRRLRWHPVRSCGVIKCVLRASGFFFFFARLRIGECFCGIPQRPRFVSSTKSTASADRHGRLLLLIRHTGYSSSGPHLQQTFASTKVLAQNFFCH